MMKKKKARQQNLPTGKDRFDPTSPAWIGVLEKQEEKRKQKPNRKEAKKNCKVNKNNKKNHKRKFRVKFVSNDFIYIYIVVQYFDIFMLVFHVWQECSFYSRIIMSKYKYVLPSITNIK